MRINISALFCWFTLALPCAALAQSPAANSDDEIIVTATRLPQKISQTLQSVTLISAEEIAQSGAQSLTEVLQSKGGVEITASGGLGQISAVRIRGAESRHTLVLVDGMRVDSATVGLTALENIPLHQIERVEIVPGALSSVYGSDAIGGVVQIFTKSGRAAPGGYVAAGIGSNSTATAQGGIASRFGTNGDTLLSIGFGYLEAAEFSATKSTIPFGQHHPDRDAYRNTNFSAKMAQRFSADHEAGAQLFSSEGMAQFDSGPATDDVNQQTLTTWSLYSRNRLMPHWQSTLRLGNGRDEIETTGAFSSTFRTAQNQFTWQNEITLTNATVTAGVERLQQTVASSTVYTQTGRSVNAFFAGYQRAVGDHSGEIHVRRDDNSQFGVHHTGSLGYAYRVNPHLRLRASAGKAFKAPTFNDLYYPLSFGFSGNPNLRPERSHSKEVGVNFQSGTQHLAVTYFDNRIDDLIAIDATFSTMLNLNHTRTKGIEWAYRGQAEGWHWRAQATFQNPVDEASGKLLPRRAKEYASVNIDKAFGAIKLGTEWVASGARYDRAGELPASRMSGYSLLNLTAAYTLSKAWALRARLNNLLDKQYELTQHYNTPDRNVFVSLHYQPR